MGEPPRFRIYFGSGFRAAQKYFGPPKVHLAICSRILKPARRPVEGTGVPVSRAGNGGGASHGTKVAALYSGCTAPEPANSRQTLTPRATLWRGGTTSQHCRFICLPNRRANKRTKDHPDGLIHFRTYFR